MSGKAVDTDDQTGSNLMTSVHNLQVALVNRGIRSSRAY